MFRTPKKAANSTFIMQQPHSSSPSGTESSAAGSARENRENNVRRSIGEWESGMSDSRNIPRYPPRQSLEKASPKKQTVESVLQKDDRKKSKYADRMAEAKACLIKAKTSLGTSRNTKTDIKNDVIHCLDRLYALVKEAESAKGDVALVRGEQREGKEDSDAEKRELLKRMEEYSSLLKINTSKIEELKRTLDDMAAKPSSSTEYAVQHNFDELLGEVKHLRRVSQETEKRPPTACSGSLGLEQVLGEVRELRRISEETERRVTHLQEAPSYAQIVARPGSRSPAKIHPTHSLIVSSELEEDTSDDVLGKVRAALDARTSGFQIHRVRKVKNQKVVLSCSSNEEMTRMAAKLKTTENLNIEEAKNKNPLVIIKDLLSYNTDADIISSIRSQNMQLMGDLSADELQATTVRYRRRARNPHENHVVLQVSPRVWQRLTSAGRIHIDMQYVAVQDQSPLVQCTRCLGYGHGRKLCTEPIDLCSYCSGPHLRAKCPSYTTGDTPICRNCKVSKYPDTNHNAFSGDCPVRKKWDAIARASVAYC